jgi:DNA repair exonuclease SbcCD ATPase subunit
MRITHLYLRNYRVYEELDLDVPPGLVGIYGANGAGKSTLVESVRFALHGHARTTKDEIRTAGVNAECVAEVEFEHEGHLYVVRRSITGINHTVKASAFADGLQVAEGVRDTGRYVHSILGMDDAAFRASVFAEQKQLDAFSQRRPEERRALVLQLLGITPVEKARDHARRDARDLQGQHDRLRAMLPDLEAARADAAGRAAAAAGAQEAAAAVGAAAEAAEARYEAARARHHDLDVLRQEHEVVAAEARSVAAQLRGAEERAGRLAAELEQLHGVAARLEELRPLARGWQALEARLRAVEAVVAARRAAAEAAAAVPPEPEAPDEEGAEAARVEAEEAAGRVAEVEGRLGAARAGLERATEALARSSRLDGAGACPLCGQALGEAFAQVQAHRSAERQEAADLVAALEAAHQARAEAAAAAGREARRRAAAAREARVAWAGYERAVARRSEAERQLAVAEVGLAAAPTVPDPNWCADRAGNRALRAPVRGWADRGSADRGWADVVAELRAELERRRAAAAEGQRLAGRLERRPAVEGDLAAEREAVGAWRGRLEALEEKLGALGFRPDLLAAARAERDRCQEEAGAARARAERARLEAVQAAAQAEAAAARVVEAEAQHAKLAEVAEEARHLARLGELLTGFRNELVATVGPRLAVQAADLFAELTDREYDELQVDPDTYEIQILDAGRRYGMDRFSGSETDLANLALRVAISEQVRFQAGGTVGLLVLDEVFGPLDDDRKERMLQALNRLTGRFRQVLVVTHDAAIKEQMPNALEVEKRPGRRATVRVLGG